jgi:hypothetical protein
MKLKIKIGFTMKLNRIMNITGFRNLSLIIGLLLCTITIIAQEPVVPISAYGIWDRGDRFLTFPTDPKYSFFKGTQLEYRWSQVQPTNAPTYDFSALRSQLELCDQYNKYAYINILVGPDCPAWIYTSGVPKVLTDATTQFNGEFPYYLASEYKTNFYNLIAAFGQQVRTLPDKLRKRIAFVQVMTGCTGDEVDYKGTPITGYTQYKITDAQWLEFRLEAFSKFKAAFLDGDQSTKIPLLFNNIDPDNNTDQAVAWQWVLDNVGNDFGFKGSAYVRGHHLTDELRFKNTWNKYQINPKGMVLFSRAEMDQSCTKTMYTINPEVGFYWGVLSGLNTGLSVHDLSQNATDLALGDPEIMTSILFFDKYAGQIFPNTATAAYTIFHEGLNSENTTKFPENIYGSAGKTNTARYTAICNAYTNRGARMDDLTAATKGQVYQRDSQTGYNDAGWSIEEGNYERFITQINPDATSIGLFRVRGTINTASSKYDRFARSFENSSGKNTMYFKFNEEMFQKNKPSSLKFTIVWLDKNAGSTWALKYQSDLGVKTALAVTGIGDNNWKTETVTIIDALVDKSGILGSDFSLVNTDAIDDIFNGMEVDIERTVTSITSKHILNNMNMLELFPNPTQSIVFLKANGEIIQIEVYDLNGKIINKYERPAGNSADLSQLKNGIYFLRISLENSVIVKKVVKQ